MDSLRINDGNEDSLRLNDREVDRISNGSSRNDRDSKQMKDEKKLHAAVAVVMCREAQRWI